MNFGNSHTYQTGTFPPLNPVKPKVRFDGEEFLFESLILEQPINSCHRFEIVREYLSQDELWKETPEKLMSLIGARTLIRFEHLTSKDSYEFSGWVTDVRIDAWEDDETGSGFLPHRSNRVRIIGRGDAMSLDGVPSMHSFIDRQLADIVSEVTREAYFKVECNPRYKGILPYAVQYGESGFEFLNRLSRIYGEPFFYDGRTLFFGVPHAADCEKLFFDSDIVSLRTCASAVPRRYAHYDYVAADDKFLRFPSEESVPGGNPLIDNIAHRSDRLFPDKGTLPSNSPVYTEFNLSDLTAQRGADAVGRMLRIEGVTKTCRLRSGGVIDVLFPERMDVPALGKFRITSLYHRIEKNGDYTNWFTASPALIDCVPEAYAPEVKAYPEMAIVSDNKDPKGQGRVRVQFDWQKPKGLSTNWIRVQTPDAGASGTVTANRGFVSIPEEGDQVMVGFEYGDPHRPYVTGSLFHGKSGKGGYDRNHLKSISTRSGHHIVFDDDEKGDWSITIKDRGGNAIRLDTRGKNIEISAPEKISLAAKDVDISGEMIRLNAKKHLSSKGQNIILESEEKLSASSKVVNVIAFNKLKTYGGENKILGRQIVQIATPKISTKMSGHSDKDPGNRNQMGNQGLTSQAGFNTIQKGKKTSQSKKNPTQEDLIREQKQMEQIKHNFYTRYALWIQEFIDVLLLWRGDIMSAQENDKIITQPISWTLKLLGASTGIAVTVDAVAFFGQKVYTLICSMGKISCSDFVAEMLDGLTQIKNGIENGGTNAVKPYISNADREGLFQKFLSFAIKQGAEVPEDYTQKLDSFFKRIRAQYPRERFYQYITFVWIRSSQDGWDLADDYAGELEIVCTMSIIGGKANWVVNEFYIDDVSNPNGLLRVLTSKQFFNGGKINALRLPIPIRVRIIPGSRILISTEARYRRNEKGKWEPLDSVNRNQILWNKFLPWANTTKQLELDKLEKD